MPIESVMPSSHLILCRPLLVLPPIPLSIRVFSNESTLCMRWPKYWSFSFSIIPSKEHPGMISFRMDWLDLLAVLSTEFKLSCLLCNQSLVPGLKKKMFYVPKTKEGRGEKKKKKDVCPFLLLENSRPLSPPQEPQTSLSLGTLDFLSTCLGIDSLNNKDHLFSTVQ